VVLADHDELTVAEFPQIAAQVQGFDVRIPPVAIAMQAPRAEREIVRVEVRDPNVLALLDGSGDVRTLEVLEAETIRFALSHYRGQMSAMARKLGIGRSTLYRKMKEYGFFQGDAPETSEEAA
jgi:Response regulator containing CheY-like receiver, AAA-type ATPase, and DNA-binding domains